MIRVLYHDDPALGRRGWSGGGPPPCWGEAVRRLLLLQCYGTRGEGHACNLDHMGGVRDAL